MKAEFTAVYEKKGEWYIAYIEEIPGVNTQGKTLKEAKKNLKEALQLILETNREISRKTITDVVLREPLILGKK